MTGDSGISNNREEPTLLSIPFYAFSVFGVYLSRGIIIARGPIGPSASVPTAARIFIRPCHCNFALLFHLYLQGHGSDVKDSTLVGGTVADTTNYVSKAEAPETPETLKTPETPPKHSRFRMQVQCPRLS